MFFHPKISRTKTLKIKINDTNTWNLVPKCIFFSFAFIIVYDECNAMRRPSCLYFLLFSSKGRFYFILFPYACYVALKNARRCINLMRSFNFMKSPSTIAQQIIIFRLSVGSTLTLAIVQKIRLRITMQYLLCL